MSILTSLYVTFAVNVDSNMSLQVIGITKKYGEQLALDNVSFEIAKGEIVGFLGPNGAGKSSLMKILTTYLQADSGQALVNGEDVNSQPKKVQAAVGYLPEHNPLYLDLYVREYLQFNASIYGVSKARIEEVIQLTGLTPEAHKKIGQLSKGYRQRVGIATALLHDPEILILDEPMTGLDPNQMIEIRQLIKSAGQNKTVFLSTHIMQEVEAICNRVIIINHGKIVADKQIDQLQEVDTVVLEVELDQAVEENFWNGLAAVNEHRQLAPTHFLLSFPADQDYRPSVFDYAQNKGMRILQLSQKAKDLESIFHELTQKN